MTFTCKQWWTKLKHMIDQLAVNKTSVLTVFRLSKVYFAQEHPNWAFCGFAAPFSFEGNSSGTALTYF